MVGRFTLALLASASLMPSFAAYAQDEVATEEIVVTASKREELLRDVPQSVTALTAQTLQRTQANNLTDYAALVPGLATTSTQPGQTALSLRGINTGGLAASVGTYVDETPYGLSTAAGYGTFMAPDIDPFDIQRIEVLRGPQGTLYGANTMGGLIKLVTVDPNPRAFEGRLRLTGESTDDGDASYAARVSLNIPVGDQAALLLSGYDRRQGGFIDDPTRGAENINSVETSGWRAKFLLNASPDLTIRLSAVAHDIDSDGSSAVDYVTGFPVPPFPRLTPLNGPLEQQHPYAEPLQTTYRILNGTIDWDLHWATLTSASSYGRFARRAITDYTGILGGPAGPILSPFGETSAYIDEHFVSDKFTQELRLASPSSEHFEWMVGYFYTKESTEQNQAVRFGPPNGPLAIDILHGVTPDGGTPGAFGPCGGCVGAAVVRLTPHYEENAVFGNATYYLTPQFDVTFGARYSSNDQRSTQTGSGGLGSGASTSSDKATTYSIAPRWRPNDTFMLYARVATGFRPGGPNTVFGNTIPATFDPDTLTSYEIGFKSDLVPHLLRLDVSAFRVDWKDIQLLFLDPSGIGGTNNGDSARSQGVEWSATLTPLTGLTAMWTGAYTDAQLTADAPALFATSGAELPNVPKWASTLDVNYQWRAFGDATAYVGGTARYVGERSSDFFVLNFLLLGDPQVDLPSYTQVDLRAGVDFDRWGLELFARNIGNDDSPLTFAGFTQTAPNALNGASTVSRPRTIGVELTARF